RLCGWLEAADLIRCEWVRGHDGEVFILAYDQVVEVRLRAQTRSAPRSGAQATRPGAEATRSGAERAGKTRSTKNKEYFSQGEKETKGFEGDEPEDALKRRCLDLFAPKGVSHDDCVRAIDQLRGEGIADHLIDAALGQCERNPNVRSTRYLLKV